MRTVRSRQLRVVTAGQGRVRVWEQGKVPPRSVALEPSPQPCGRGQQLCVRRGSGTWKGHGVARRRYNAGVDAALWDGGGASKADDVPAGRTRAPAPSLRGQGSPSSPARSIPGTAGSGVN